MRDIKLKSQVTMYMEKVSNNCSGREDIFLSESNMRRL